MQCFGGYWNDMADNPAGWSAHLDASCNYIANTAVGLILDKSLRILHEASNP